MTVDREDIQRIEGKVDKLTEAVMTLVRVEERQHTHGVRLGLLEERMSTAESNIRTTDGKVDRWINRGIGVWGLAVMIWTLYLALKPVIG